MKTRFLPLLLMLLPAFALASPGDTDANGGHYEHATGLYHYHHGYAAHQHENGICPETGEVWELKIPERPATLAEWKAMNHTSRDDVAVVDDGTDAMAVQTGEEEKASPAPDAAAQTAEEKKPSPVPYAAAGGAAVAAGAAAFALRRKKKKSGADGEEHPDAPEEPASAPEEEPAVPADIAEEAEAAEPAETSEEAPGGAAAEEIPGETGDAPDGAEDAGAEDPLSIPADAVIGEDGLPWEREAYERWNAKKKADPYDTSVPTNYAEPKWGRRYTFCTDADGDEIHTIDCELAFIQINAADPHCPKQDCKLCHPVRPDLRWYAEWKRKRKEQEPAGEA